MQTYTPYSLNQIIKGKQNRFGMVFNGLYTFICRKVQTREKKKLRKFVIHFGNLLNEFVPIIQ